MAADEEIAGHEIAGEDINPTPLLPPTSDPADTCVAYAEIEYASNCVASGIIPIVPLFDPGESCDAYAEIEYAGECVSDTAIFPGLPTSSVEEFDTTTGRLGCGVPTVFITSRCSGNMTCQIDLADITRVTWTRILDDVSEAEVEIGLTGDSEQTCCQCLGIVEPFCHELHIWRDGDEVWVGPIEAIRYERERVTIKARDSLAWMDVRIPNEDFEFETIGTGVVLVDNPLLPGATTLNGGAGLAALPVVTAFSPSIFIVLEPSVTGRREVVQIQTHTAASTSATIVRAQQGTLASYHPTGSAWRAGSVTGPEQDLSYIAQTAVFNAFEEDINNGVTCEFDNIYLRKTGQEIKFYKEAFNETYLEILLSLLDTELSVTTLGRTIVITGDTEVLTPLSLLTDDHIMGEVEITKDGKIMGNRQYVHYDGDGGIPAIDQMDEDGRYCYSLVERIRDGGGIQLLTDAQDVAAALLRASFIAPRVLEIPDGSRLSPDTPWTINQMVCGARVNVAITKLCFELTRSFVLTGVTVEYTSDGESVGISLSPLNNTTDSF